MIGEMGKQMLAAFQWLGLAPWSASLVVMVTVVAFYLSSRIFSSARSEDSILVSVLAQARWIARGWQLYQGLLAVVLRRLDGWIGDDTVDRRGDKLTSVLSDWFRGKANPWTKQSYDLCLRLALLYPSLGLFAAWLLSGVGRLGPLPLLETKDLGWRLLVVAAISASVFAFIRAFRSAGWKSFAILAVAVAVAVVVASAVSGSGALAVAVTVAGAVVVVAVSGSGAGALAVAGAVALAVTVAVILAIAGAGVGAVAVAVAGALAGAGAVAVAGAGAVAGASTFGILYLSKALETKGLLGTGAALFWAGMLGIMLMALWLAEPIEIGPVFLFLGFLPLANAPLDWLSLGLTRGLLREALLRHRAWGLVFSTSDLLLAMVLMVPLICLTVGMIRMADLVAGGGGTLLNLTTVLTEIVKNPTDAGHYWVYFMFFSTLIPTLAHAGLAIVGIITGIVSTFGLVADRVEEMRNKPEGRKDLSLSIVWPIVVAVIVGGLLVSAFTTIEHVNLLGVAFRWYGGELLDLAWWAATVGT